MHTVRHQTSFPTTRWSATGIAAAIVRLLLSWQERASQRRHLSGLGERALKDIGLSRADIDSESGKPFWRS